MENMTKLLRKCEARIRLKGDDICYKLFVIITLKEDVEAYTVNGMEIDITNFHSYNLSDILFSQYVI